MKVLHLADIHAQDSKLDEVRKCLGFIIEIAEAEKPDLIIVAGDIFNSRDVKLDSLSSKYMFVAFQAFATIAPVVVVLGTPSHDGTAAEVLKHIKGSHPISVSATPRQLFFNGSRFSPYSEYITDAYAIISILPTPTKQFFKSTGSIAQSDKEISGEISKILAGFGAGAQEAFDCPHILIGHFQVGEAYVSESQQLIGKDIEISRDQIALANADLVCLGHIHKHQKIGENIFYSGSTSRNNYGELEEKGFYIHELERFPEDPEQKLISRFIETPTRKLIKDTVDFCECTVEEFECLFYSTAVKDALVRVEVKVYQDEADKVDQDDIKNLYMENGARDVDIKLIRIPRENVRSQKLLGLKTLREKLIEAAALRNETVSESILDKADMLESMNRDEIINQISRGEHGA